MTRRRGRRRGRSAEHPQGGALRSEADRHPAVIHGGEAPRESVDRGLSARHAKNAVFEAIALMGKAFGSPRRLELLDLLAQGSRTVDQLARASEQSTANTSQHLQG